MKLIKLVLACVCMALIAIMPFVGAAQEDAAEDEVVATDDTADEDGWQNGTSVTFGQCVSDAAAIKNTCYSTTKDKRATCKENAADKAATKQCKKDYKAEKKQCKADFKAAKKQCNKIDHIMWDSVKASMK